VNGVGRSCLRNPRERVNRRRRRAATRGEHSREDGGTRGEEMGGGNPEVAAALRVPEDY